MQILYSPSPTRMMHTIRTVLGGLLAAACMVGCSEETRLRHVVLISIDTLRADHLGSYGYERATSPALDRIAESGALFLDASTTSPWTLPSHASLLTGLYPSQHGVKDHINRLSGSIPTLASILGGHGYQSFAVVNSHNLAPRYGLDQGFESFEYVREWNDKTGFKRRIVSRGDRITERAIEWLKERDARPFFLFLHYYDVHSGFEPQPKFREMFAQPYGGRISGRSRQLSAVRRRGLQLSKTDVSHLVDLYDAEIRQLDSNLQRLFGVLEDANLNDDVLVIITSDHGEEFMEHGSILHGRTYYQEIMRIPLIIRGPGVAQGIRIDRPASLVDIAPTVLGLLSLRAPDTAFDGVDLSSALRSPKRANAANNRQPTDRLLFAEADHGNEQPDLKRMARQGRFKLVLNVATGESRLHDLLEDPDERVDISVRESDRALRLERELQSFMKKEIGPELIPAPDADTLELLEELGYVR